MNQGHLYIISGPSGVGKGTLVSAALEVLPNLALSISATTRKPRLGDIDGVTYHFLTDDQFDELIRDDGLLEWAEVHGCRYGTLINEVEKATENGVDLVLEIDQQGNDIIKARMPEALSIFIAPPSMDELRRRLEKRGTECVEAVEQRLRTAELEMAVKDRYNVIIVNDDLEKATEELIQLISSRRANQ